MGGGRTDMVGGWCMIIFILGELLCFDDLVQMLPEGFAS
jgi:hypothetical protein